MPRVLKRSKYTLEFAWEEVRYILAAGQSAATVVRSLGISKASLGNWVRQNARGELDAGAGAEKGLAPVTPKHMGIARLRAENMRLKMDRDMENNNRLKESWQHFSTIIA